MAFGFQGPISASSEDPRPGDHGMVDYALSRAYRILSADRNQIIASCKVCGTTLLRDHGHKVSVTGLVLRTPKDCFLCSTCFAPVKAASEAFPLFNPLPSWWRLLDREPAARGEKLLSQSQDKKQIERMIHQRQHERQHEKLQS